MQVIAAAERTAARADRVAIARGVAVTALLVGTGLALGWLVVGTPILHDLMPGARPSAAQAVAAIVAWAFAIVVPAGFILLGLARGIGALEHARSTRPAANLPRLARELGPDYLVVTGMRLPDGRWIPEIVLGPFGLAVIAEAPPMSHSRRVGNRWEVRGRRGRWIPIDDPLERTARDADRVRRWLGEHDSDFVVKTAAALVTGDARLQRTTGCAVVAPGEVAAWLRSLPPQRGLTPPRRERLVERIRAAATPAR